MGISGAKEKIHAALHGWPGITSRPHRFGGTEYSLGRREIGHLHGDSLVDIPFPTRKHSSQSGQMHVTSVVTETQTLEIAQAVHALTPFAEINAAKAPGFEVSRSFPFEQKCVWNLHTFYFAVTSASRRDVSLTMVAGGLLWEGRRIIPELNALSDFASFLFVLSTVRDPAESEARYHDNS